MIIKEIQVSFCSNLKWRVKPVIHFIASHSVSIFCSY